MPNLNNKTIIEYIPIFLRYCKKEKHFSSISVVNYQRFLKVFIEFLEGINKENLLPRQLDKKIIQDYKLFIINRLNPNTNKSIKKSTQNYYLISLRSLVSFLDKNGINTSIKSNEINLVKQKNVNLIKEIPNLRQLEILKSAPNINKINGLRDRAIIELLLSTGLKISQITKLDKDQIGYSLELRSYNKFESIFLHQETLYRLKEYLEERNDRHKALFINYQGRKNASRRLTDRSIERSIKKYAADNNLPNITPEILRNANILNLFNKSIKIDSPFNHKLKKINFYKHRSFISKTSKKYNNKLEKSWDEIEKMVKKEFIWLKEKIDVMPKKYRHERLLDFCDDCLFRKIAILIVSGKIKAIEYKTNSKKGLWHNKENLVQINRHGEKWHREMMGKVASNFKKQNYEIILEPTLNYGRADLGVCSPTKELVIIEIGTVSLLKLWYNLSVTKNLTYLIIPYNNYVIEFKI